MGDVYAVLSGSARLLQLVLEKDANISSPRRSLLFGLEQIITKTQQKKWQEGLRPSCA